MKSVTQTTVLSHLPGWLYPLDCRRGLTAAGNPNFHIQPQSVRRHQGGNLREVLRAKPVAQSVWHLLDQRPQRAVPNDFPPLLWITQVIPELQLVHCDIGKSCVLQERNQRLVPAQLLPWRGLTPDTGKLRDATAQQTQQRLERLRRKNRQTHAASRARYPRPLAHCGTRIR